MGIEGKANINIELDKIGAPWDEVDYEQFQTARPDAVCGDAACTETLNDGFISPFDQPDSNMTVCGMRFGIVKKFYYREGMTNPWYNSDLKTQYGSDVITTLEPTS